MKPAPTGFGKLTTEINNLKNQPQTQRQSTSILATFRYFVWWGRVFQIVCSRRKLSVKPAPTGFGKLTTEINNLKNQPQTQRQSTSILATFRYFVWWGRVFQIVCSRRKLSVKPAPTGFGKLLIEGGLFEIVC